MRGTREANQRCYRAPVECSSYEQPSIEQRQVVSRVLVQGKANKENDAPCKGTYPLKLSSSPNVFGSLFSGGSNCTINISPRNLCVSVGSNSRSDFDVKSLMQGIDLESFLSS